MRATLVNLERFRAMLATITLGPLGLLGIASIVAFAIIAARNTPVRVLAIIRTILVGFWAGVGLAKIFAWLGWL